MAHTKAKGSTKNNRDSQSKRLGLKVYGGALVKRGMVLIRQRGSRYYLGQGVSKAGDDTIFATKDGVVTFAQKRVRSFAGLRREKTVVNVV